MLSEGPRCFWRELSNSALVRCGCDSWAFITGHPQAYRKTRIGQSNGTLESRSNSAQAGVLEMFKYSLSGTSRVCLAAKQTLQQSRVTASVYRTSTSGSVSG